jgi:pimeloyl-ACP methyl ester carboxylesterase
MKRLSICILLLFGVGAVALTLVGSSLGAPARAVVGSAPPDLGARSISLNVHGDAIAGWAITGKPHAGAVLLLHGVRANRLQMLERARFLSRLGYSVVLIDLQAHGESGGEHMGFGAREADGVTAALGWMRRAYPGERIGVIGVSLGAASLVLAHPTPAPAAVVLESMYPTIEEAVANRLGQRLGAPGRWMAPLLVMQLPLRYGIWPSDLRPVTAAADLHCPVLVISGSADLHTTADETRRIFAALPGPKQLWLVDGAAHVDLHSRATREYETRVGAFLANWLRVPSAE